MLWKRSSAENIGGSKFQRWRKSQRRSATAPKVEQPSQHIKLRQIQVKARSKKAPPHLDDAFLTITSRIRDINVKLNR
jgi:hypothetical protein